MSTRSVMRQRVLSPVAVVLLPAYLSACFRYVSAEVQPLPHPRSEVRVHLAEPIQVPLGEVTLHDVTAIEGIVSDAGGDTIGVYGKWLYPQVGSKYDALGASFRVATTSISRVDRYRFSPKLTAVALAVTGAVIVSFLQAVRLARGDDNSIINPPPPEAAVRGAPLRQ